MPAGHADFRAYMHTMIASDDLFVTDAARDLGIQIVLRPPADPHLARAKLRAPHGTLDLPDFAIEVIRR